MVTGLDDAASVVPSFTPDVAGDYVVGLVVNDGVVDSPPAAVTITATAAPNTPPVLELIGDLGVEEGVELLFTAVATDADVPADVLTFSLEGAPVGAEIDPVTGLFSWTPAEADGPGVFGFDVVVVDDGTPVLEGRETITVTVAEVNAVPVADAGGDASVLVGETVVLDGSGSSDADVPVQSLGYSWSLSAVPAGSVVTGLDDAASVVPSFTPDVAGDYVVGLVVNDGVVDSPPAAVTITATAARDREPCVDASERRGRHEHPAGVLRGGVRLVRELAG